MVVLKVNQDVDIIGETSFSFDYPMSLAFARSIDSPDGGVA